jgi:hypothetical protein
LAQCVPRLIGLSQAGSCPVQTPFCTSACTVQPTEQCVQMFFLMTVSTPGCGPGNGFRLAHRRERQRADRRQRARRETGPPQETAAIHGVLSNASERRHEGAALRLACTALRQHRRLYFFRVS